jgi:hypothetical protein
MDPIWRTSKLHAVIGYFAVSLTLWDGLCEGSRRLLLIGFSTLKMEVVCSSEMSVDFQSDYMALHPRRRTNQLTNTMGWVLLEKLLVAQLLKNFPAFYETQRFITVITSALHWPLSWARSIQSIQPHPISLKTFQKGVHFSVIYLLVGHKFCFRKYWICVSHGIGYEQKYLL